MPMRPVVAALAALLAASPVLAQGEASVETMAALIHAQDARRWDEELLQRALSDADTMVRAQAAIAVGRLGDLRGTFMLVPALEDPEATVRPSVAFALGLLRDSAALEPLVRRITVPPGTDLATTLEVVTAIARIGGPRAAEFFAAALGGSIAVATEQPELVRQRFAFEAWRFGPQAPITELLPLMQDTSDVVRWYAAQSLGRLRQAARPAGERMASALRDKLAAVRATAARTLTPTFADSAGLSRETVVGLLERALTDDDPGVRINALRSIGMYRLPAAADRVAPLVADPRPQVALQAVTTLGELGGPEAVKVLQAQARPDRAYAFRREALRGLARADTAALRAALPPFVSATDWRDRAVAAEATATAFGPEVATFLTDADGRVVATALDGWLNYGDQADAALVAAARPLLAHPDVMVRTHAATAVGRAAGAADLPLLVAAWERGASDSIADAQMAAANAALTLARTSDASRDLVLGGFLGRIPAPTSYVLRLWAEENWPAASQRWGAAFPLETGRSAADYREIARRFYSGTDRLPRVTIEVDQKGTFELELFGPDAPMTVASFLQLMERRYYDRLRFHRVVPNFVVQDGDPRGDGNGGPGFLLRDEVSRQRFDGPRIGMAHSGPETAGSQWFINLSPQPHLDGAYTVFGRVTSGMGTVLRIVPGDQIRTMRR